MLALQSESVVMKTHDSITENWITISFTPRQSKTIGQNTINDFSPPFAKNVYRDYRQMKKQDKFVDVLAKKMLQNINSVRENFSDIGNRQIFYYQFKQNINEIWDFVSDDDSSKELVMVLTDCINNIKSENLNFDQLDALKEIIGAFTKEKITEDDLDCYMELLLKNNIPLVLLPTGISDLYD